MSAYISPDDSPLPLASRYGSQEYQDYMATAALKDEGHESLYITAAAHHIFSNAIQVIRTITAAILDSSSTVNITSIAVPNYLQHIRIRKVVKNAAIAALPGSFTYFFQVQSLTASARLTYQLNTCEE
jgi:hypothetical protein